MTTRRLRIALALYAALAVPGFFFEERVRWVLWIFLAALAVKSWIAWAQAKMDEGR